MTKIATLFILTLTLPLYILPLLILTLLSCDSEVDLEPRYSAKASCWKQHDISGCCTSANSTTYCCSKPIGGTLACIKSGGIPPEDQEELESALDEFVREDP